MDAKNGIKACRNPQVRKRAKSARASLAGNRGIVAVRWGVWQVTFFWIVIDPSLGKKIWAAN